MTSIMDFLSIRISVQSVIAAAVHMRRGRAARQPSPKKSLSFRSERTFPVNDFHHGFLIDPHQRAIGHCGRSAHAERPCCEATFSEEIALIQNAYCGFLPARGQNGEFYLSPLYVENRIGRVALSKDCLFFGSGRDCPAAVDGRKEGLEVELVAFLDRCHGCHDAPPLKSYVRLSPRTASLKEA